jgi:hypothetical protein
MYSANKIEDEELTAKLPEPVGYKILIAMPEMSEKTEGGVFVPDALKKQEETASIIGYVIKTGLRSLLMILKKFPSRSILPCGRLYHFPIIFRHSF